MTSVEIWLAMNEDGDAVALASTSIGEDMTAEVSALMASDIGGAMCRIVRIPIKMKPPEVAETSEVRIADDTGETVELD